MHIQFVYAYIGANWQNDRRIRQGTTPNSLKMRTRCPSRRYILHLFKYENINLLIKLMLAYSSSNGLVFIKKYCNFITKTKLSKHSKKLVT